MAQSTAGLQDCRAAGCAAGISVGKAGGCFSTCGPYFGVLDTSDPVTVERNPASPNTC